MRALMRVGLKFARTPAAKQRLLLEALLRLGWARVLKAMPFARIAPSLGEPMRETPQALPREEERQVREISQAVRAVSRHTPWQSRCLVQAIAAQRMLARRRIACTLYLGTARDRQGRMVAHAWTRSGNCYVTGAEERRWFTTVAIFGNSGNVDSNSNSNSNNSNNSNNSDSNGYGNNSNSNSNSNSNGYGNNIGNGGAADANPTGWEEGTGP